MNLKLVKPNIKYKAQIEDVKKEIEKINQSDDDGKWYFKIENLEDFIEQKLKAEHPKNLPKGRVPESTFWMIDEKDLYIGRIAVKHSLTKNLEKFGGHIAYDIRPSKRQKGYASKMLTLGLTEAHKLGLNKVLITCYKDNIASQKVIKKAGGYDQQENLVKGRWVLRYWVKTK